MSRPSERLRELNITLPAAPKPVAAYVPCVRQGELLFLSGQIPMRDGKVAYAGLVPTTQPIEHAQDAARICTLNAIAVAAEAAGGIDNIRRIIKVVVYVASEPTFGQQHLVANGASQLLVDIFGDAGKHARAAVGVPSLPMDATVEVDITFAVA